MTSKVQDLRVRAMSADPLVGPIPSGRVFGNLLQANGLTFEAASRLLDVGLHTVRRYASEETLTTRALHTPWCRRVVALLLHESSRLAQVDTVAVSS